MTRSAEERTLARRTSFVPLFFGSIRKALCPLSIDQGGVAEFCAYGERPIDPIPALFRLRAYFAMCLNSLKDVPSLELPDDLKEWS